MKTEKLKVGRGQCFTMRPKSGWDDWRLAEKKRHSLRDHLRISLSCAALCSAACEEMSTPNNLSREAWKRLADLCTACADECKSFADVKYFNQSARIFRKCAIACLRFAEPKELIRHSFLGSSMPMAQSFPNTLSI